MSQDFLVREFDQDEPGSAVDRTSQSCNGGIFLSLVMYNVSGRAHIHGRFGYDVDQVGPDIPLTVAKVYVGSSADQIHQLFSRVGISGNSSPPDQITDRLPSFVSDHADNGVSDCVSGSADAPHGA